MKLAIIISLVFSWSAFASNSSKTKKEVRKIRSVELGNDQKELGELLSEALSAYLKKSGHYAGMGQGWSVYYMGVRCAIPEGTGNSTDKSKCYFVEIK